MSSPRQKRRPADNAQGTGPRSMHLTLRAGERLFLNGAVLRTDRKVSLELLNDATFLLENHVLQVEDTTTPLRQLYFAAQAMLMDPQNADASRWAGSDHWTSSRAVSTEATWAMSGLNLGRSFAA